MKSNAQELFPVVDEQGNVVGSATRGECHSGSMLLHPVVHLHVITPDGKILLQRRSMCKDIQPGRWDTAVGGHVDFGEAVDDALRRECSEELGFTPATVTHLVSYNFQSDRERERVNVYATVVDDDVEAFDYARDEIDELRFWTSQEIADATGAGILTPNFEQEYRRLAPALQSLIKQ